MKSLYQRDGTAQIREFRKNVQLFTCLRNDYNTLDAGEDTFTYRYRKGKYFYMTAEQRVTEAKRCQLFTYYLWIMYGRVMVSPITHFRAFIKNIENGGILSKRQNTERSKMRFQDFMRRVCPQEKQCMRSINVCMGEDE